MIGIKKSESTKSLFVFVLCEYNKKTREFLEILDLRVSDIAPVYPLRKTARRWIRLDTSQETAEAIKEILSYITSASTRASLAKIILDDELASEIFALQFSMLTRKRSGKQIQYRPKRLEDYRDTYKDTHEQERSFLDSEDVEILL
jgi:hypothetical protein